MTYLNIFTQFVFYVFFVALLLAVSISFELKQENRAYHEAQINTSLVRKRISRKRNEDFPSTSFTNLLSTQNTAKILIYYSKSNWYIKFVE